jgi:E3 ubiquitin-protein ligase HACE1
MSIFRSFYKHVLGVGVDYIDIEATEPEYYKTLKQILDNSLELLMIDLTFVAESHNFGETEVTYNLLLHAFQYDMFYS